MTAAKPMTGGARTASDATSTAALTTVRRYIDAARHPVRHAEVAAKTMLPAEIAYVALRRLVDRGEIRAEFVIGERGSPGTGTWYMPVTYAEVTTDG